MRARACVRVCARVCVVSCRVVSCRVRVHPSERILHVAPCGPIGTNLCVHT